MRKIGITAGTSAPEVLIQRVITHLEGLGVETVRSMNGVEEKITFSLPEQLANE